MSWNKERITGQGGMPEKGRGLDDYEEQLGFSRKELEGKKVLDLGSGTDLMLEQGLKDAGIGAYVVNFSPDFSSQKHAQHARESSPAAPIVAGVGEALPFADRTFDVILCLHVLEHLPSRDEYVAFCREVIRVLTPGGRAYLGPVLPHDARIYDMAFPERESTSVGAVQVHYEQRGEVNVYDDFGYRMGKEFAGRYMLEKSKD